MDEVALLRQSRARRSLPPPEDRRSLRERAGVTQAAIAEALGVSRKTISHWEQGTHEPRGEALVGYLGVLQLLAAEVYGSPVEAVEA